MQKKHFVPPTHYKGWTEQSCDTLPVLVTTGERMAGRKGVVFKSLRFFYLVTPWWFGLVWIWI